MNPMNPFLLWHLGRGRQATEAHLVLNPFGDCMHSWAKWINIVENHFCLCFCFWGGGGHQTHCWNFIQACHDQCQFQFVIVGFKVLIPCSWHHAIIDNMPLAELQTWNACKAEQKPQTPQVQFNGCRGQRGKLPTNKTATRMINEILAIRWCQSAFADKQTKYVWLVYSDPCPPKCSQSELFVESTLVVAQVPGSGAHNGLAIFWKQPCRLQNFGTTTEASTGIFQIFVARCRCPWHDEPNPTVQAGHLFRFSLIRNIAWEHYFVQMYVLNVLGYACITAAINVLTAGYSYCVWLILSLSNLINLFYWQLGGQFSLQTLLWSKCGSRCRDWWRFWSFGELIACLIFWGDGWVVFLCRRTLEA